MDSEDQVTGGNSESAADTRDNFLVDMNVTAAEPLFHAATAAAGGTEALGADTVVSSGLTAGGVMTPRMQVEALPEQLLSDVDQTATAFTSRLDNPQPWQDPVSTLSSVVEIQWEKLMSRLSTPYPPSASSAVHVSEAATPSSPAQSVPASPVVASGTAASEESSASATASPSVTLSSSAPASGPASVPAISAAVYGSSDSDVHPAVVLLGLVKGVLQSGKFWTVVQEAGNVPVDETMTDDTISNDDDSVRILLSCHEKLKGLLHSVESSHLVFACDRTTYMCLVEMHVLAIEGLLQCTAMPALDIIEVGAFACDCCGNPNRPVTVAAMESCVRILVTSLRTTRGIGEEEVDNESQGVFKRREALLASITERGSQTFLNGQSKDTMELLSLLIVAPTTAEIAWEKIDAMTRQCHQGGQGDLTAQEMSEMLRTAMMGEALRNKVDVDGDGQNGEDNVMEDPWENGGPTDTIDPPGVASVAGVLKSDPVFVFRPASPVNEQSDRNGPSRSAPTQPEDPFMMSTDEPSTPAATLESDMGRFWSHVDRVTDNNMVPFQSMLADDMISSAVLDDWRAVSLAQAAAEQESGLEVTETQPLDPLAGDGSGVAKSLEEEFHPDNIVRASSTLAQEDMRIAEQYIKNLAV
eukprot:GFYU01022547.1.p1 GENE.GFYU01022547.1~~GFYU01022547.1.p1  ORF type:complete len:641 (-),score=136.79 GFYU01022547.1:31-1953(-)